MDASKKRKLFIAVAATILLLVVVLYLAYDGRDVLRTMRSLDPGYILLALLSFVGIQIAWALKWFFHVRKVIPKARFYYIVLANMTGNFVNLTTPSGRLAGEPVRASAIARRYKAGFSDAFATTMVDKMGLTVAMIVMLVPVLIYSYMNYDMPPLLKYFAFVFFLFWIIVGLTSFWILKTMKKWNPKKMVNLAYVITKFFKGTSPFDRQSITQKLSEGIQSFRGSFKDLLKDPFSMTADIILGISMYLLRYTAAYLFFVALGYPVSFLVVAVVVHIAFIIGLISQLPGGAGASEGSMFALYSAMGVDSDVAFSVAILTQMNSYFVELGLGYISTWFISFLGVSKRVMPPFSNRSSDAQLRR